MVKPEVKKKRREQALARNQSRKKQKKLEKVVSHKKNKVNRTRLLAELKQCQLQPNQLNLLHSTSSMQTKGLKRFLSDDNSGANSNHRVKDIDRAEQCLDASLLLKRKKRKRLNVKSSTDSSSSEDTDAISTDTEIYCDIDVKEEPTPEQKPSGLTSEFDSLFKSNALSNNKPSVQVTNSPEKPVAKHIESPTKVEGIKKESIPAVNVPVSRDAKLQASRLELPIIGEEQAIVERIRYNDVVIVSGETGSGKTTQIPQFLYEAGYTVSGTLIGITEPRRVAAVSMSERVARELNLTSDEVSYQIRYAGNTTDKTKIKFMTDGVLLKECQEDFLLSKYSVIIIDEAHERSVFSDILIGILSRIVPMRRKRDNPLKLVIMSATLKVDDFKKNKFLFKKEPPLIEIKARQHKVTMQFAKKTPSNYLQAAYKKVCSIHSKHSKPNELKGGILVFVTSQMDVKVLCKKLSARFSCVKKTARSGSQYDNSDLSEWSETDSNSDNEGTISTSSPPLFCLGLYAMLPLEKQKLVFKNPPEGSRLCVVATNVAETSITIPNIRYVVDTGKEKMKEYDKVNGVSRFLTGWTSKSSAEQRMGRAGRMGPGYCYRLYSSAVYTDEFPEYAKPHILQKPIEDVLLQMKSMKIDNVINFPFPFLEKPRELVESLMAAEKKLILLGALDDTKHKNASLKDQTKTEYASRLTTLGKAMAKIAVDARYSKMIVQSPHNLLPQVIPLVSALSVREIFIDGNQWRDIRKSWAGHGGCKLLGDYMVKLRAVSIAIKESESSGGFSLNKYCSENGLQYKAMLEVDKLRKHLTKEISHNLNVPDIDSDQLSKKPDEIQSKLMRQLLLSSYCDHVAKKLPDGFIEEKSPNEEGKIIKKRLKNAYESMETNEPVYISSESILKSDHPEYVIYKELYQVDKKTYMRDVAVIDPSWLPQYASKLCSFGSTKTPLLNQPKYDKVSGRTTCAKNIYYGPHNWPLGLVDVPMSF